MNIYYPFDCTFISGQKCQSANHKNACKHMPRQAYSPVRLGNGFKGFVFTSLPVAFTN